MNWKTFKWFAFIDCSVKSSYATDKDKIISLVTVHNIQVESSLLFNFEWRSMEEMCHWRKYWKDYRYCNLTWSSCTHEWAINMHDYTAILFVWVDRSIHTSNLVQVLKIDYLSNLFCIEHFVFARPITYIPISVSSHIAFSIQSIARRRRVVENWICWTDSDITKLQSRLNRCTSACILNDINLGVDNLLYYSLLL